MLQRSHHINSIFSSNNTDEYYLLQVLGQYPEVAYFKQNAKYTIALSTKEQLTISLGFNLAKRNKKNPKAVDFAYEVTGEKLGKGGQGDVYSSKGMLTICVKNKKPSLYIKRSNKRIVKVTNNLGMFSVNSTVQRHCLEQEYEVMASLCEIYRPKRPAKDDSVISLVSARFEGLPLNQIHNSSIEMMLIIFINLLKELQNLERRGVTHRDIKHDNMLVARDLSVKIIDFGYAINTSKTPLDEQSQFPGTSEYASPEIFGGLYGAIGSRSDIYNTGRMLLFSLSNSFVKYQGKSCYEMILLDRSYQNTSGWVNKTSPYDGFEDDLKQLLNGMLALNSAQRFSCSNALEALELMQSKIKNDKSLNNIFYRLSSYNILQVVMLLAFGFLIVHMSSEKHHSTDCSMNVILISMGIELLSVFSTYIDLNSYLKTAIKVQINPCNAVLEVGSAQVYGLDDHHHYVNHRAPVL